LRQGLGGEREFVALLGAGGGGAGAGRLRTAPDPTNLSNRAPRTEPLSFCPMGGQKRANDSRDVGS